MKTVGYLPKPKEPKDGAGKTAKTGDGNKPKDGADPAPGNSGKDGDAK